LLFIIVQHNKIAGELWLNSKLDEWCNNQFMPLVNNDRICRDTGLYL
jgi:hypothetical protein